MGLFRLQLKIDPKNFDKISEMRARLDDFSVPFVNIISAWAKGNVKRKFAKSVGQELTGSEQSPASWAPVTMAYYRQKHGPIVRGTRTLYPDWLMVRTGALMEALGTRGGFGEFVDKHRAVFGTPMAPDEAAKASGNKASRPTVFLDRTDRGTVRMELQRYLSLGENYKTLMWQTAGRKAGLQKMVKEMDINFQQTV